MISIILGKFENSREKLSKILSGKITRKFPLLFCIIFLEKYFIQKYYILTIFYHPLDDSDHILDFLDVIIIYTIIWKTKVYIVCVKEKLFNIFFCNNSDKRKILRNKQNKQFVCFTFKKYPQQKINLLYCFYLYYKNINNNYIHYLIIQLLIIIK